MALFVEDIRHILRNEPTLLKNFNEIERTLRPSFHTGNFGGEFKPSQPYDECFKKEKLK